MQKFIRLYKSLANTEASWKPEESMHAVSYAFGREEEGSILGSLVWVHFYNIYGKICGIPEIFPEILKSVIHIPEEWHLGLASLRKVIP